MLRLFLRDYDRHIEQLAQALETGEDGYVVKYGEWLVPIYRRRRVPDDSTSWRCSAGCARRARAC